MLGLPECSPGKPAERPLGSKDGALRGKLLVGEPLARHTSWRVGGPADRFYLPADADDLARFMRRLPAGEPVFWLGLGSNLLVRDAGLRGTVICIAGVLNHCRVVPPSGLWVEAGVACAKAARASARAGCTGAEFLAGIPGTVGGALAMNAGAFGAETWEIVGAVETVDRNGTRRRRGAEDYLIGYREVRCRGHMPTKEWFIGAELRLNPDPERRGMERIKTLLARRAASQPMGQASCGSVFRNPPGDSAGRLIESCGLKGHAVGGACVSERHANFIVNRGGASAADIEALIESVRERVQAVHGITLVPEVHIVGEVRFGAEVRSHDDG